MINILIIDDSEIIRSLLKDYFEEKKYTVETASDGKIGLEKALAEDYTVIFCDIHMPKKNGYKVLKAVLEKKPHTKFIMTDSLPDELAEMAEKEGAYCVLTKPFDLDEVDETIDRIVATSKCTL